MESQNSHISSTSFINFLESKTKSLGRKLTKEEIAQSRVEWKQEYHKSYHLKRKVKEKRLSLRFSSSELKIVEYYAKEHRTKSLSKFIKNTSMAYLEGSYIPRDGDSIKALTESINSIGRNINQVVQKLHRNVFKKRVDPLKHGEFELLISSYDHLLSQVRSIEQDMKQWIRTPPIKLEDALLEFIDKHPDRKDRLIEIISGHHADH